MTYQLFNEDNLAVLRRMPDNSIDAVVTDPPYGLGKEPDALTMLRDWLETGHHEVKGKGFMGKSWDAFVPQPAQWHEVYRVLKPGGHVLTFAGTRTQDLVALGLRIAGFEIRDLVAWCYGQGFPKSSNIGCKCGGGSLPYTHEKSVPREPETECVLHSMQHPDVSPPVGTSERRREVLQPGLSEQGSSATRRQELPAREIWQGQSSMEGRGDILAEEGQLQTNQVCSVPTGVSANGSKRQIHHGTPPDNGADDVSVSDSEGSCASQKPRSSRQQARESGTVSEQRSTQKSGGRTCPNCKGIIGYEGWGTALKPALEPITLARKPLGGTVAQNVLKWHTGALNIDGCRVEHVTVDGGSLATNPHLRTHINGGNGGNIIAHEEERRVVTPDPKGRWPANVIHDGSDEVVGLFPETISGGGNKANRKPLARKSQVMATKDTGQVWKGEVGSASRFFYCAKTNSTDRNEGCSDLPDKNWQDENTCIPERENRPFNPSKNDHPTVKPTMLMRYLCRLITPPGGTVLDPWMGSGSTGKACAAEGFSFIGIDSDTKHGYFKIAQARVSAAYPNDDFC
jgi:DNA modification methylase